MVADAEVLSRLEKIAGEIESLHRTMGVLIDDVADLETSTHGVILEVRSIRAGLARMEARIRMLERKAA